MGMVTIREAKPEQAPMRKRFPHWRLFLDSARNSVLRLEIDAAL
jgi:hypothetical protein